MAAKIINIVSGKGGTGKTLLTAVMADMLGAEDHSVVVVDLDVFVRGLTALLYFHKKERIQLTDIDEMSVSEYFIDKGDVDRSGKSKFSISRYRNFNVLPSVARVDEILKFQDLMPDSKAEAGRLLSGLIDKIDGDYDYIFLDSRAGYDELIAASHLYSDVTICVEEPDDISKITTDNLIEQLRLDSDSPIYRVTNKSEGSSLSGGITHLGNIPFDMDVMRSFGTKNFWDEISRTLYKEALAQVWNRLVDKEGFTGRIRFERRALAPSAIESRLQYFGLRDRIIIVYGFFLIAFGFIYGLYGQDGILKVFSDFELLSRFLAFFVAFIGLLLIGFVMFKGRK
ncbi:ParA family protein [Vogesella urethralis]|uniref:ParA family protein n=1 Tax=Vogesella urethralis TaxID=2592656 RepID=UPI001186E108|nr:ParA family protein [Vogesella urethralis]